MRHICKLRYWFKTFNKVVDGITLDGNNFSIKLLGKGQVKLVFTLGNVRILIDVYYAPETSRNLSWPTLMHLGYKLVFEADRCIISKCGVFVGHCYLVCNLSKLSLKHMYDNSVLNLKVKVNSNL